VKVTAETERPRWRLTWRTPPMDAPAFWYFEAKREALAAARRLSSSAEYGVARTEFRDRRAS
jgi:hypothetical protein